MNSAVLAELGLLPLSVCALKLSVGFWLHLSQSDENTIAKKAYCDSINIKRSFSSNLRSFLYHIGIGHIWENQSTFSQSKLMKAICRVLSNRYISFSGETVCI